MNQGARPHPAQVPVLTEVIELLGPTPVGDDGMHRAPRAPAPAPGEAGSVPIVTGGLGSGQARPIWTPMSTVVLHNLDTAPMPPAAMAELPVLEDAVAYEPELAFEPALASAAVLEPAPAPTPEPEPQPLPEPEPEPQASAPLVPDPLPFTEAQVAQRVMGDVQKQIDSMLDFRLREALAPILARHSDALVRDLREELNRTMRDVVARSVSQEMAKLRQR